MCGTPSTARPFLSRPPRKIQSSHRYMHTSEGVGSATERACLRWHFSFENHLQALSMDYFDGVDKPQDQKLVGETMPVRQKEQRSEEEQIQEDQGVSRLPHCQENHFCRGAGAIELQASPFRLDKYVQIPRYLERLWQPRCFHGLKRVAKLEHNKFLHYYYWDYLIEPQSGEWELNFGNVGSRGLLTDSPGRTGLQPGRRPRVATGAGRAAAGTVGDGCGWQGSWRRLQWNLEDREDDQWCTQSLRLKKGADPAVELGQQLADGGEHFGRWREECQRGQLGGEHRLLVGVVGAPGDLDIQEKK